MNMTDVDADRLLSVRAQIAADVSNIVKVRNYLRGQVVGALEPYWQGQAKETFTQQFNAFLTNLEGFSQSCEELNAELEKAGKSYNNADAEVNRLTAGLPN
ncbi:MAG: WXG100 family type VII secretion target [Gracilibacteraceae bacterium]|jgi:WXG100 family type VII secretion target|nr:WXG100 family type VII secretion target [Gracilibacteraceae bacterium]